MSFSDTAPFAPKEHFPDRDWADPEWLDYCRTREIKERAAAKNAGSSQARRVHQELAIAYADVVRKGA